MKLIQLISKIIPFRTVIKAAAAAGPSGPSV